MIIKTRKKTPSLLHISVWLSLLPAFSANLAHSGNIYLGIGLGQSDINPESLNSLINTIDGNDDAYAAFIGYGLNDFLSLEGFYSDLGEAKIRATQSSGNTPPTLTNFSVSHKSLGLNLLLHFPDNNPGFSGFLKLGLGALDLKGGKNIIEKPDNLLATLGLGIEYQLHNGVFFRGDYSFLDKNTSYATLNIGKKFGVAAPPPATILIQNSTSEVEPDTDGDGIADSSDQCPNTQPGIKVSSVGCKIEGTPPITPSSVLTDTDGDGILDESDNCPRSQPGARVNSFGCIEIIDSDHDGIYDHIDQCPDTPQKSDVDSMGCPIIQDLSEVLIGAYFRHDSDELTDPAKNHLDNVIKKLSSYPNSHIHIIGHTDDKGNKERNLILSKQRAKAVLQYLVTGGITPERMQHEGKGESSPLVPNNSRVNRAKNRRVELIVSDRKK